LILGGQQISLGHEVFLNKDRHNGLRTMFQLKASGKSISVSKP
jgi:hypothetical protein